MTEPVRVVVVNAVALNTGDAAILKGLVASLRDAFGAGLDVRVADDQPEASAALYPELEFVPGFDARRPGEGGLGRSVRRRRVEAAMWLVERSPRLARALLDRRGREHLDRLAGADAVISTGGTYFVEHYPIRRRAFELLAARSVGTPTFLYTQSMGPFRKPATRRLMRKVLGGARGIFLRDERSREHVLELGVNPAKVLVRPDAAFALAAPERAGIDSTGGRPLRRVAVSVRHWRHFGERGSERGLELYRRAVAAEARRLHEAGAEVVFLSTCQGVAEYWTDDSRFARRLVDELLPGLERVRVDGAFRPPERLVEELAGFDLVIATRMHLAILALCAGVPVVPIAYEFKTRELFAQLGMESLVTDIATITPESLRDATEAAAASLSGLRERIVEAVAGLAPAAGDPARVIRDALAGGRVRMERKNEEPGSEGAAESGRRRSERPSALIFRKRLLPWSETFIANQGKALDRYHPVFVGYQRMQGGWKYLEGEDTVVLKETARVPLLTKGVLKALGWVTPDWAAVLAERSPKIVHAHFGVNAMDASALARRFDVPLVVTFHGMDIAVERGRRQRREQRRVFDRATRVIAVSEFIAAKVRAAGCPEEKLAVHHIGVDTERFSPGSEEEVVPGRVLFLGRLVPKKGLDHLLRAMSTVRAAVPGAELIIVGDGPLRERMEAIAREHDVRCRFMGVQSPEEVAAWLRSAAVLAAPSVVAGDGNAEGLPMTIMEAQATGVPVVAYPSGGSAEGVEEGRSGFVVAPRDEPALAERLIEVLSDDGLRRRLSEGARDFALREFDLRLQTERLEAIYDDARGLTPRP